MTAGILARQSASTSGLRPIDPRRDMAQVADLIEVSFRGDLDPMGRRMVREMRALGRAGWIGWAVSQVLLPPVARPQGFVWEQAGRVVGNASLLPVRGISDRWVLANVAVSPEYRRRGIGRQMVKAAIAHARQSGGESLYLQVERENDPALLLYAALGFQAVTTRTTWRRQAGMLPGPVSPPVPPAPPALHPERQTSASSVEPRRTSPVEGSGAEGSAFEGYIPSAVEGQFEIRPRKRGEWAQQWELALQAFPDGLVWPYPLDPDIFRGSRVSSRQDWLAWHGGRPVGSLTTREGASMRMILLATAESQGEIERELVSYGLSKMRHRKTAIVLDYLADLAVRELKELGFREERTLTWMSRRLKE